MSSLILTPIFTEVVGTVVGHFAGIAASIIIGGWAATFIASQAVSYLVGEILILLFFS